MVHSKLYVTFILPFTFNFVFSTSLTEMTSPLKTAVQNVLSKSAFKEDLPPQELGEAEFATYDPMLVSVVASLKSRTPKKEGPWKSIDLPSTTPSAVCSQTFQGHYKKSSANSPYTFVVLPGAYATWKRGSFTNQTVAVLNAKFNDPNILAFEGYLTPNSLDGCQGLPWDSMAYAKDLYQRISTFLKKEQKGSNKTGVIGFSGGGFLALAMMAHDSQASQEQQKVFNLGGLSFSPILHGRTAFKNLDTKFQKSENPSQVLTKLDFSFMAKLLTQSGPQWQKFIHFYNKSDDNASDFLNRAFNEFTAVDLEDSLDAVHTSSSKFEGGLSYFNAYIKYGFGTGKTIENDQNLSEEFDKATDIRPAIQSIASPLLIYFSQDDPVLSSHDSSGQPAEVTEILKSAEQNSQVTVFNPQFGAHTGALLDPIFDELVETFFKQSEQILIKDK